MHLLRLPEFVLQPERVPALLLICTDKPLAEAASRARAELATLVNMLTVADLLRAAAGTANAHQALTDLAKTGAQVSMQVMASRMTANDLLSADAVQRKRFDGAAIDMAISAGREKAEKLAAAGAIEATDDEQRRVLAGSGLSAEEIDSVLAHRQSKGGGHQQAKELRSAAADLSERERALLAFIADPLRDLSGLPPALAADLQQHARDLDAIRGPAAQEAQRVAQRQADAARMANTPAPIVGLSEQFGQLLQHSGLLA